MLITDAELMLFLGIESDATDRQRAIIATIIPEACSRVKEFLHYDPEQRVWTELYPRADQLGGWGSSGSEQWDVNPSHTRAFLTSGGSGGNSLQLQHLPVRSVTAVHVDESGNWGQATSSLASDTLWVLGEDYWIEFTQPYPRAGAETVYSKGLCKTGCLMAYGNWPTTAGSVRVQYRAGYSPIELLGRAEADATAADGTITQAGVDASAIKRAVRMTAVKAFHTWEAFRKKTRVGFVPGNLKSESAGEYSYSADGSGIADMTVSLPDEAKQDLQPFVHYGIGRL